ncbi:MAG: hypothetical protein JWL80_148 [Parcubacteria group bacterium]|nr:hypothetical protein [Parcubacteria group bacterium]
MESSSVFQQQNPLSSKKFTKKFIPVLFRALFLTFVASIFGTTLFWSLTSNGATHQLEWSSLGKFIIDAVGFYLLIVIGYALYIRAYIKRYYYDAGEQFITIKKGVFAPTEIHVQYGKIQDVYVDQDILDRILGIYDVHIASATFMSGIEAHIDGVNKDVAERIKNTLLGKITNGPTSSAHVQTESMPSSPVTPSVHLSREISSSMYPFDPMFRFSVFISSLLYALVATVFMAVFLHASSLAAFLFWFVIVYVLLISYELVWMKNYFFSFEKDMIVIRSKVIGSTEKHVPYHTIQDVVLNQGVVARLFGIGSVIIQNATAGGMGSIVLPGQPIAKAKEIVEVVRGIIGQTQGSRTGL